MHNNYYFIRKLSSELGQKLAWAELVECFSQSREELIFAFLCSDHSEIYLQAHFLSGFSCLYLPEEFRRAKRNVRPYFPELAGKRVSGIKQARNERAFLMEFDAGDKLLFKLYGNRSNIIFFNREGEVRLFKNNLVNDRNFFAGTPDRELDLTWENFEKLQGDLKKFLPTLGKEGEKYLALEGYNDLGLEEKYKLLTNVLAYLESPEYLVIMDEGLAVLSLFRYGEVLSKHSSAIEALNAFYQAHFRYNHLGRQRLDLLRKLDARLKSSESYISKCEDKLKELEAKVPVDEIANIIMANLHAIPAGAEKVKLYDFYRDCDIEVRLKKDLSPQKNAELLYRKSKNKPLEQARLKELVEAKMNMIMQIEEDRKQIENAVSYRELEPCLKKYQAPESEESGEPESKFKFFDYKGFRVLVGRNADNNDELTQKFARKDDLWLHAKDVTGSHVVIKKQPGKNFPKDVIEKAASVAAWYSKRKNDSLCPVIYTEKKYVRKVKGAPKGSVKVDRESVIMVVPSDF